MAISLSEYKRDSVIKNVDEFKDNLCSPSWLSHFYFEVFKNFLYLQNAAVQLVASNNFPVCLKNKAAYFVKRDPCVINKDNLGNLIIFGDMATKPIEQLASIVDEVGL